MNEKEIQKQIVEDLTTGDYSENLAYAISLAAKAVSEVSTDTVNYLLFQSVAQSLIAMNLQLEDLIGYIMNEEN